MSYKDQHKKGPFGFRLMMARLNRTDNSGVSKCRSIFDLAKYCGYTMGVANNKLFVDIPKKEIDRSQIISDAKRLIKTGAMQEFLIRTRRIGPK